MRLGLAGFFASALAVAAYLFALAPSAIALEEPGWKVFEMKPSTTQAGGHPDIEIDFEFNTDDEFGCEGPGPQCLVARQFAFHWPEGFIGNPHVALKCRLAEFSTQECPADAQIGSLYLLQSIFGPLYNMETNPAQAGLLGTAVPFFGTPIFIELSGRTDSDYGLDAVSQPQFRFGLPQYQTILWGVPASETHVHERFISPIKDAGVCFNPEGCPGVTFQKATIPERPFLQNPTTCGVPLTASADVYYYGGREAHTDTTWPETTNCSQASFNPSLTAKPTTSEADTASGLDAILSVPQVQSPTSPSPSELRTSRVTLPEGMSINPNAADGKVACPESQTAIGTLLGATCPEFSKIGTLMIDVSALPGPIPGAMYLAEPLPGEPYRVLLAADGFATHVKLLGTVEPDPVTGQVTVVFEDLPQAPLQEFELHLFGSERGLLATPSHCGTYPVETEFVPWNSELTTRHTLSTITIGSGPGGGPCPSGARPFAPTFSAGSVNNTAGMHTPFSVTLDREDGQQNLIGLTVQTPPGFAGTLRGIPYCPEGAIALLSSADYKGVAEQNSPACPVASEIGTVTTGAGSSSHPVYVSGKVFLAGPYKGAPLSLVAVVPAVSGPYDLGNVAVRAAIQVDPVTAQVTTVSDPLPQILDGIPLRTRSVIVDLNRPNFTFNSTNCAPFSTNAMVYADEGAQAPRSAYYQVANCADLDFAPKMGIKLRGSAKRRGHPAARAIVRRDAGEANLRRTVVAMPKSLLLDNAHIGTVCTRVQFAADSCPPASIYGNAMLETPLLDQPLRGPVYLRSSNNPLPDLVVALKGQIEVELAGKVGTTKQGGLRTTFSATPDAPFTKFVLNLQGGKKGLLINSRNLCKAKPKAFARLVGQNGKATRQRVTLQTGCRKSAKRSSHRRRLLRARAVH